MRLSKYNTRKVINVRKLGKEGCGNARKIVEFASWSALFLSYRGIHIYLHIARSGATVVPRSRVQAREALPRASSRNEQPPFSEQLAALPSARLTSPLGLRLGREIDTGRRCKVTGPRTRYSITCMYIHGPCERIRIVTLNPDVKARRNKSFRLN